MARPLPTKVTCERCGAVLYEGTKIREQRVHKEPLGNMDTCAYPLSAAFSLPGSAAPMVAYLLLPVVRHVGHGFGTQFLF